MSEYKLINALPQSAPGNIEQHFGHSCKIKSDGVYIELDELSAANFLVGGHISGPVIKDVIEDKPQSLNDVVANGSGKRQYNKRKDSEVKHELEVLEQEIQSEDFPSQATEE